MLSLIHIFRDKDYVVANSEVLIVDECTGRIMPGRRFSDGLHQAIEAKEHVLSLIHICLAFPSIISMAPSWQAVAHRPQPVHFSSSILIICLIIVFSL